MKTKGTIALLALALLVAWTIQANRRARQDRAHAQTVGRHLNELRSHIASTERRLQAARAGLSSAAEEGTPTGAAAHGAETRGVDSATSRARLPASARGLSPRTLITNDPAKFAEFARNYRGALDLEYGCVFKALRLPPDVIDKFKDIEVSLLQTSMDLQAAMETHAFDRNSPEGKKLWDDYNASRTTKKAELLGDQATAYFDYYRTWAVRGYAAQLAATGVISGELPSAAQVDQAADILVEHAKRRGGGKYPGWAEPHTIDWPAARAQLKDVLSPAQIELLGGWIERDKLQSKVNERVTTLTAQFKGKPPAK